MCECLLTRKKVKKNLLATNIKVIYFHIDINIT